MPEAIRGDFFRRNVTTPFGVFLSALIIGIVSGAVVDARALDIRDKLADQELEQVGAIPLTTAGGKLFELTIHAPYAYDDGYSGDLTVRTGLALDLSKVDKELVEARNGDIGVQPSPTDTGIEEDELPLGPSTHVMDIYPSVTDVVARGLSAQVIGSNCEGVKTCQSAAPVSLGMANALVAKCLSYTGTPASKFIDAATNRAYKRTLGVPFKFMPSSEERPRVPDLISGSTKLEGVRCYINRKR